MFSASPIAAIGKSTANIAFFLEITTFFGIFFTISAKKTCKIQKKHVFLQENNP